MPTNAQILGFGNQWYQPALEAAVLINLPSGRNIRLVSAPYFLITKLVAFEGRGHGDYLVSHDIEDVVALLDGRSTVVDDVRNSDEAVKNELKKRFSVMERDERFLEAIPGHLPGDAASQARFPHILEQVAALANLV